MHFCALCNLTIELKTARRQFFRQYILKIMFLYGTYKTQPPLIATKKNLMKVHVTGETQKY